MEKEAIKLRLVDLTKRDMDLAKLMDLTIYEVSREIDWSQNKNYGVSFHVLEFYDNKPANHLHTVFRYKEADAFEILSLLLRIEKQFDKMRNAYISVEWK